jgi:hypothetical protein
MSQRERHASGTLVAPGPRAAEPVPPRGHRETPAGPVWDSLFPALPPDQQDGLLDLAARQGFLRAEQLPPALPAPADHDRARRVLTQVFGGTAGEPLPAFTPEPPDCLDGALDGPQRDAVAKALATPDLCLIRGAAGTGKSRTVVELIRQAVRRGERVLLLAPAPAALDHTLARLAESPELLAVRCLDRDERPESLPAASRPFTFAEQARRAGERAAAEARAAVGGWEDRIRRLLADEPLLDSLRGVAAQLRQFDDGLADLSACSAAVPGEVEALAGAPAEGAEPGSLPARLAIPDGEAQRRLGELDAQAATLAEEQARHQKDLSEAVAQMDSLQPLAEARQHHRWWTGSFWKAKLAGDVAARLDQLDAARQAAEEALTQVQSRAAELQQDRQKAEAGHRDERDRLVREEVGRRQAELAAAVAERRTDRRLVEGEWDRLCGELSGPDARPTEPTDAAIDEAGRRVRALLDEAERSLDFARRWADWLAGHADELRARLAGSAQLVAATTSGLPADEQFGDAAGRRVSFDLLILEDADQVTESEFLHAARRARRWVLVGEPSEATARPAEADHAGRAGRGPRPRGPGPVRSRGPAQSDFFARLWQHLHADVWVREGDRLCCRLRPVPPDQRGRLEREPLADSPDVELRILTPPDGPPALAEIAFPAGTGIDQAKAFVYRELGEVPVQAGGPPRWVEGPDRLLLQLGDPAPAGAREVTLESGLRERVGTAPAGRAAPWYTCCLEFERAAGWERPRAEEWVGRHLRRPGAGRTARLETCHRMRPHLAELVGELFLADAGHPTPAGADSAPAVEFIPVPGLPDEGGLRRRPGPRRIPAGLKGGAGLEVDLADARHRGRLPAELLAALPERGLVNLPEAEAVVRLLEDLADDPAAGPAAVVALSPAQAALIRRLAGAVPALAGVVIDGPEALRHHESATVVVSLTRSHTHRAVPYGDSPRAVALAATRARRRLILVGDPGTLARRSQWDGPLDHLGAAESAREKGWVAPLVGYLQGHGPRPELFRLCEGYRP